MAEKAGWIKKFVAVACLGGSALAIYNVNFDIAPLQKQAETEACGADGCAQAIAISRSPISQNFTFQVQANSAQMQKVECTRSLLLAGDYSCKRVAQ